MAKIALLVGVSEYEPGLNPLPGSVLDVDAMRRVLVHPEMGGFEAANVTTLKNPPRQEMEEAIEHLFTSRQKDDLVLLYFSGHGIKDDLGKLFLATAKTRKHPKGELVRSTAVAAAFLHDNINRSRSQRQVIVLDCCFSGAIAQGMTVKDDGAVNLQEYLGGKGRAILTSSTSTEYSFGSQATADTEVGLSIYTRYLVEGIETGAADTDDDGLIAVQELHEYAASRVKEAAPAMNPKFYPVEQGYKIILAKSPTDDPKLQYRKELQKRLEQGQGKLSIFAERLLKGKQREWGISAAQAQAIRDEVLQPYREYESKLQEYEQALTEAVQSEYPFSSLTQADLNEYQQYLKLRDSDIAAIKDRVLPKIPNSPDRTDLTPLAPLPFKGRGESGSPLLAGEGQGERFSFEVVTVDAQGKETSRQRHQAEVFTEDLGDGVALEMVKIPGGSFLMGQTEAEKQELIRQVGEEDYQEWFARELPQHEVALSSFLMGKYPITQAQYERIMGANPSRFKGSNRPVEQVSWFDAVEFCQQLSQHSGRNYRLPSEAEWEYACRAVTNTPFYFGETITTDLANYQGTDWKYQGTVYPGNYGSGPKGEFRESTTDVGTFPPNAFGLYDLHGNVWEWCGDSWHENYADKPQELKNNGILIWSSSDKNSNRVLRGGSWCCLPRYCRSALRNASAPDIRDDDVGFRVVCAAA